MPLTLTDILLERRKKEERYFKNYTSFVKIIKKEAQKLLGETKVFVFGSMVRKEAEPGSDIDILIISPNLENSEKKSEIRTKLQRKIGINSPFELHLITPKEYKEWYQNFIKEKIEI